MIVMKRIGVLIFFIFTLILPTSAHLGKPLEYATPESVGMNGRYLHHTIDTIVSRAIAERCFPGCQVLVARRGKIVHHKSYGHHTYDKLQRVENNHLYDIASCTKVMASTLCLMRLVEEGRLSLDEPLSKYFAEFRGSNKEECTLREILAHQSGIKNIYFGRIFFDKERNLNPEIFSNTQSEAYPYKFCDSIFVCKDIHAKIYQRIAELPQRDKTYHYTCTPFHCVPAIVERVTGRKYEDYLCEEFYKPLGAKGITYNPTRNYPLEKIVPTEKERLRREILTHGYVHDEAAALLGGVSGNAGIFASAESLAPILQMLLNKGTYGGKRYFKRKTIKEWTQCQYPENGNHRALGFDRCRFEDRVIFTNRGYYYAPSVSDLGYGHSGFTGTMVWVDPKEDLVFVFLCNRVHPSRTNEAFSRLNPRARCHEAVYESIRRFRGQ